ncbi:hypothetical protein GA0115240_107011 [Streptomyces sp. DvalAA-14]|uniref:hypothetical protein n=1 Tax=unclassified Streptomyces TaxID=2593676 RepID=UPI00081B75D2|nr:MULTISPECIES: hypothetical protein [unclassified Streptomyces]MYS19274.1 hypothetical protein [Streptomyces sp. SID4948]SCD40870.1 hypothetical protein GA0115240_107011 [Streptomyces sp. DvalAA-14]
MAAPRFAHAAGGWLGINGVVHTNPEGCYDSALWPLSVDNHTDAPVIICSGCTCSGDELQTVEPGDHAVSEFGSSVLVLDSNDD